MTADVKDSNGAVEGRPTKGTQGRRRGNGEVVAFRRHIQREEGSPEGTGDTVSERRLFCSSHAAKGTI